MAQDHKEGCRVCVALAEDALARAESFKDIADDWKRAVDLQKDATRAWRESARLWRRTTGIAAFTALFLGVAYLLRCTGVL